MSMDPSTWGEALWSIRFWARESLAIVSHSASTGQFVERKDKQDKPPPTNLSTLTMHTTSTLQV